MPEPIASVLTLVLVAVLLVSCFGIGSWILARIPGVWYPAERLYYSVALGCGVLAALLLALGSVGLLQAAPIWAVILLVCAATRRHVIILPECLRSVLEPLRGLNPPLRWIVGGVFATVLLVLLVGAMPPTTDWDSLMYHLEIPRQFLSSGRIHLPEDNLHVAYVGLWHMLYLPFLGVGAAAGPALLNAAVLLLLGLSVLTAGDRLFGPTVAAIAYVVLWGTSSLILVAVTPRLDVSLAFVLFLVHYAVIRSGEDTQPNALVVAAMLAGIAVGMKYHALPFLAALSPVAIWMSFEAEGRRPRALRLIGMCSVVAAVVALPWLLKNVLLLGAPFYPFFTARLMPPWLAAITGSMAVPEAASSDMFRVLGQAREPVSLWALLFAPASVTVEAEARSFSTNPAIFLLPIAFLFIRTRSIATLLLPTLGYLFLLTTVFQFTNLRYLIPAIPALTLVIAESARRAGEKILADRPLRMMLVLASVLSLLPAAIGIRREIATTRHLAATLGLVSDEAFLAGSRVPGFSAYFAATHWVNDYTAPRDRILLLFMARGYYFDRQVLQDNILTNWPLLISTDATSQCLKDTAITHVLVNHGAAGYYRIRGSDLSMLRWQDFPDFSARCLDSVHRQQGYELFRVKRQQTTNDEPRPPSEAPAMR